uniref:Uncharacterized protein n=1 Tax=Panagrolaimus sp. ES5 TaxID=591445 RepID=A0AC34FP11_9BILA
MVVPIGIDPLKGVVAAYSTLATLNIEKITPHDTDIIDSQFQIIKERFPAIFVNVCIYLNGKYGNDIRMAFVENAKKQNFTNFSILDFTSALYIHAVFKSAFKSENSDKIWIFWEENCYIYQQRDENIVFLESNPSLRMIKNGTNAAEKPAAIFCQFSFTQRLDFGLFPESRIFYFTSFMPENAALIKAQFIVGNTDIVEDNTHINELSMSSNRVIITIDLNGIFTIEDLNDIEFSTKKDFEEIEHNNQSSEDLTESPPSPEIPEEVPETFTEKEIDIEESAEPEIRPPSNIKPVMPNYIIPEQFEHYVEIIRQLGTVQTELNILNPLVAIPTTDLNLTNFQYLQECHKSYRPAIVSLETLLENVRIQIHSKIDKYGGKSLTDFTDFISKKHETLKQNYDKNEIVLQKAEKYLSNFNEELEWINSKIIDDEMKFDSVENALKAIKMLENLKQELRDHEESYHKVINDAKEFITKNNKDEVEKFLNNLENKWEQLQDHFKFYSIIVTKVQKAAECFKRADAIEEWISLKNKMISGNDSNIGSEIIKEILMKKTKKSLDEVKVYFDTIQSFEKDTNAIKKEIILSGNATKTKLSAIMDQLETRMNDVKKSYEDLKEKIKDQIKKLEDEKVAFEFYKKCNAIEKWIKTTIESIDIEITKDNVEMMKNKINEAEDDIQNYDSNEFIAITKIAEELIAAGFPEAKLKIKHIENKLSERDTLIKDKTVAIENMTLLKTFLENCDTVLQSLQEKIEVINKSDDKQKTVNANYADEMDEKIKELVKLNEELTNIIEEKSKSPEENEINKSNDECKETSKLDKFYDTANEILNFLESANAEIEWSDAIDTTSNILIDEHMKLKEKILSKQSQIETLELLGRHLLDKDSTLSAVSETLEKIAKAKETLDMTWQKRFEDYQYIDLISTFNALAEDTVKIIEGCFAFLDSNEAEKNTEENEISEKMAEANTYINNLQETAQNVIEAREELAEFVYAKVDTILEMHQKLLKKASEFNKPKPAPPDPTPRKSTKIQKYFIPRKIDLYDNKINAVGIDLGTSRCCMAVSRNNKIETVALENTGERPLPSFVSFDEEAAKCGDIVVHGLQRGKEKYTCFDIKRIIGKEFHDIVPDRSWPFEVIENENGKVVIKTKNVNGETFKTPEEISAILLKYMKEKAKEFQGKPETKAVLTVPAAFTDSQKEATLEAAKLAGWENITLLPEPIAASFAYFNNREIPNNSNVLLFDLGGGTLDVCLFKIINGSLQIISNIGDTCLGGRDIDNLLIGHFTTALKHEFKIDIKTRLKSKYKMMIECQKIKHNLTIMKKDLLDAEAFDASIEGHIDIERQELEEMVMNLIQRMRSAVNKALSDAKLTHKEIHKVLQVGGGCRMPIVKEMLKNMFKNAEHCVEEQPDEVVAVGAAIYAYHLATKNTSL